MLVITTEECGGNDRSPHWEGNIWVETLGGGRASPTNTWGEHSRPRVQWMQRKHMFGVSEYQPRDSSGWTEWVRVRAAENGSEFPIIIIHSITFVELCYVLGLLKVLELGIRVQMSFVFKGSQFHSSHLTLKQSAACIFHTRKRNKYIRRDKAVK